jgi:tetratricopeptide (TPR) repeat protein
MNKFWYGLPAAILGSAIIVVQSQAAFAALSTTEVASIARQVTVQIFGQNSGSGSGVIIAHQEQTYYVLTATHVVANLDEYDIVTPDGKKYRLDYNLARKLPNTDLALVQFNSLQPYKVVAIGNSSQVKVGSPAYVAGFPQIQGSISTSYRFTEGQIAANAARPVNKGYALAYWNDTFAGMSGGSILNQNGQLIGIHGTSYSLFAENKGVNPYFGTKTSLNMGIPVDTFLRLVPQITSIPKFPTAQPLAVPSKLTASDLYIQGIEKLILDDSKGAIADFDQAIRLQPDYAAAYFQRGGTKFALGNKVMINIDSMTKAMEGGYYKQAEANIQSGIADYNQAIRLNPNDILAYNDRGNARDDLGNHQGAIADYNQAIRLNPNFATAYFNRGNAYANMKDYPSAIASYDQAIRLNPNNASAYLNRGRVRTNYTDAITDYDQAIRLYSNNPYFYMERAGRRRDSGNKLGAVADYQKAADLLSENGDSSTFKSVQITLRSFNIEEASKNNPDKIAFQKRLGIEPWPEFLEYYNLGVVKSSSDPQGAIFNYDQAIRLNPNFAAAYNARGWARLKLGDKLGAISDLKKAAELARTQRIKQVYEEASQKLKELQH